MLADWDITISVTNIEDFINTVQACDNFPLLIDIRDGAGN